MRFHKDMAKFSHDITGSFDDWWSPTEFGVIRFKSSDALILFTSGLRTVSAFIQTSNAEVRGELSGKNRVDIKTSNSPISIVVWMSGLGNGSDITLITSNGTVDSMFGVTHSMVNTTLRAEVHTSHAAVRVLTDPLESMATNSSLVLDVSTSFAPVSVYLAPAYEGSYDLITTVPGTKVVQDPEVEDPSEMGRQRTLRRTSSGQHARGYLYWSHDGTCSEEGRNRGSVRVRSSESAITMYC
ncbi:hypothetical protein C8R43DRAFT_145925 [Mycena crocata]|nr:hypothetical protein C8R43DRAFT_145925 [Mycena crocata]